MTAKNFINTKFAENHSVNDVKEIDILARRWFQKSYGNTYFHLKMAVLLKDQNKYEIILNLPFKYGYGDHCLHVAKEYFCRLFNFDTNGYTLRYFFQGIAPEYGIVVTESVIDVDRKKDM